MHTEWEPSPAKRQVHPIQTANMEWHHAYTPHHQRARGITSKVSDTLVAGGQKVLVCCGRHNHNNSHITTRMQGRMASSGTTWTNMHVFHTHARMFGPNKNDRMVMPCHRPNAQCLSNHQARTHCFQPHSQGLLPLTCTVVMGKNPEGAHSSLAR